MFTATIRAPEGFRYYQDRLITGLSLRESNYPLQRTIPSVRVLVTPASTLHSYIMCRNINRLSIEFAFYTGYLLGPD